MYLFILDTLNNCFSMLIFSFPFSLFLTCLAFSQKSQYYMNFFPGNVEPPELVCTWAFGKSL